MSAPKYKSHEVKDLQSKDPFIFRKILEHERIHKLVQANRDVISYEVTQNSKIYPHPPTVYHITYSLESFIGIEDDETTPIRGKVHEMRLALPTNFPEQTVECKMLTPVWHPNFRFFGPFKGDICTNHKGFGGLYELDEFLIRIGEFLQYKRYLAEDRKPWPEDPKVARWVRDTAEAEDIVNKDEGIFTDDYVWNYAFNEADVEEEDDDIVVIEKTENSGSQVHDENIPEPPQKPAINDNDNTDEITFDEIIN